MFSNIINEIENKSSQYSDIDMKIVNFIKMIEQKNKGGDLPEPTPLRVSTRSAKCTINTPLILEVLGSIFLNNIYNNIVMGKDPTYLIKGISMKDMVLNTVKKKKTRRKNKKNDSVKQTKKSKKKEHFYNQCSVIIKPDQDRRPVNIKLFLNGSVSMTGCLENKDGYDAMCVLIEELKKYPEIFVNQEDADKVGFNNYQITMINSDYSINFKIDRLKLYNLLRNETDIFVTYEPENYPGKDKFYCNTAKDYQDGICRCMGKKCKGKGLGHGEGECKKITVAIFQSGSIIITGARAFEQTEIAYNFINKFLLENYSYIIKFSIIDYIDETSDESESDEAIQPLKNKKKIKIKNKKNPFKIQPSKLT